MQISLISVLLFLLLNTVGAQSVNDKIKQASDQLKQIELQRQQVIDKLEVLKLESVQQSLDEVGLPGLKPGDELVKHAALTLAYAEKFEQARWVAHIILPDIMTGGIFRTNDFRVDEKVKSGSAEEADYFLKTIKADSTVEYDAFGYDRGHLAPSADFRWSRIALSESYYYSNMSPQLADFNRGAWGDLEDAIRGYIYSHTQSKLYVVTGPVLSDDLPVITRGKNKVSIPKQYFKVVMDPDGKKGIAFLMPNRMINEPLKSFATSIDEVEKLTGLDFFNKMPDAVQTQIESQTDYTAWLPLASVSDVAPLAQEKMEKNHFNTITAKQWMGQNQDVFVCGTVVGARLSKAGNVLINLDKQFPNQVFTIFVKKEHIVNFNYDLVAILKGKVICGRGKVINQGGTPTMYIESQNDLSIQ